MLALQLKASRAEHQLGLPEQLEVHMEVTQEEEEEEGEELMLLLLRVQAHYRWPLFSWPCTFRANV